MPLKIRILKLFSPLKSMVAKHWFEVRHNVKAAVSEPSIMASDAIDTSMTKYIYLI